MPHAIILMNDAADELKGDATTGAVVEFQTAFNAADAWLPNNTGHRNYTKVHNAMDKANNILVDGGTLTAGVAAEMVELTTELNTLINE